MCFDGTIFRESGRAECEQHKQPWLYVILCCCFLIFNIFQRKVRAASHVWPMSERYEIWPQGYITVTNTWTGVYNTVIISNTTVNEIKSIRLR